MKRQLEEDRPPASAAEFHTWACNAMGFTDLSLEAASATWRAANGDVARAVDLLLSKDDGFASASSSSQVADKAEPGLSGSAAKLAKVEALTEGLEEEKNRLGYLGDIVLVAYSTVRGDRLRAGETITVERSQPAARAAGSVNSYFANRGKKENTVVRFSARSIEVGRFPSEASKHLCKLLDQNMIEIEGVCVDCPFHLEPMNDILLSLRIFLCRGALAEITGHTDLDEQQRTERRTSLLGLFNLLSLRPLQACSVNIAEDRTDMSAVELPPVVLTDFELATVYGKTQNQDMLISEMDPLPTMMYSLRSYQKQALHWMYGKETGSSSLLKDRALHPLWAEYSFAESSDKFYYSPTTGGVRLDFPFSVEESSGGILADEMGLGKTIEMLSLIHSNRPPPRPSRTTQSQSSEPGSPDAECGSGPTRPSTPVTSTSHITLVVCPMSLLGQWKREAEASQQPGTLTISEFYGGARSLMDTDVVLTTYGTLSSEYSNYESGGHSPLFGVSFYRVVLDEAHMIKSRTTAVAKSCYALKSRFRWAVTGTPLQNKLDDLYSLLSFLKVEPWSSYYFWRAHIGLPFERKEVGVLDSLQNVLQPLLLRRTKDTKGRDGKPIVELPPKHVDIEYVELSAAERDFYDAVYRRSKLRFDDYAASGQLLSNYASIFQLLMRLRQCCDHPYLTLRKGSGQSGDRKDDAAFADLDKLLTRFMDDKDAGAVAYASKMMDELRNGNADEPQGECPVCLDAVPADATGLTPCLHVACHACLLHCIAHARQAGQPANCPVCRTTVISETNIVMYQAPVVKKDDDGNETQSELKQHFKSSAKIDALLRELQQVRVDSGNTSKAVVFSQFTSMLDLVEIPLSMNGFKFVRLDGSMPQVQREAALRSFVEDDEITIFLVSLRSGGVGLNLANADRCYLLDIWWNPAVEEQAIDRVHRVGQTSTVYVKRFIVRDSVEERMLALQDKKRVLVKAALGSGSRDDDKNMRIEDLKNLFS